MKKRKITEIDQLRIALNLSGVAINNAGCELILLVQKKISVLGGNFSVKDGVEIEHFIRNKYERKKQTSTTKSN